MTDVQFGLLVANIFLAASYIIRKQDGMCSLMFAIWFIGLAINEILK